MALLLSLEASADFCSAALHNDGELIAIERIAELRSAASQLAPAVQKLLHDADVKSDSLNGIAIAAGPGSYTGLRIVTSLAKGMCSALDVPLIAVDTLDVLTNQVNNLEQINFYCPCIDARRNEIYYKVFDALKHECIPTSCLVVEKESFRNFLETGRVLFFGSGAAKTVKMVSHPNADFLDGILPDAGQVGLLAYEKWRKQDFVSREQFEPFYLKEFLVGRKPETL